MTDQRLSSVRTATGRASGLGAAGPWILWVSTSAALLTTIHHLHGARIYETPARYHAVWLAVAGVVLEVGFLLLARSARAELAAVGRLLFRTTAVLFFVLAFGAFEGGVTHIGVPLLQGGYGADEPFDLLFEATGVLQVVPAIALAVILFRTRGVAHAGHE